MVRGITWAMGVAAVVLPILNAIGIITISWWVALLPAILIAVFWAIVMALVVFGFWYMSR